MTACGLMTQHVHSEKVAVFCRPMPVEEKKNSRSVAEDAAESEPWQAFLVVSVGCEKKVGQISFKSSIMHTEPVSLLCCVIFFLMKK